ncbi:MAG: V-type ATP synthase subunit I [Pseudomonadota bacterium]|nr:V-type ATP synthase subunit I [Pseudomonadota bacterium]
MSILRLQKISLIGRRQEKAEILDGLQSLGLLHLVNLASPKSETNAEAGPGGRDTSGAKKALRWLRDSPVQRRAIRHDNAFDATEIVGQINANQRALKEAEDRRDFLRKRISDVTPWGNFRLPGLEELGGYRFWFYIVPHYQMPLVAESGLTWAIVGRDRRNAFVVVISKEEPGEHRMPVARTHTGELPLRQLEQELEAAEVAVEEHAAERVALTRWRYLLKLDLAHLEDQANQQLAADLTLEREGLFAVQGWVAESQLAPVREFADTHGLVMLAEKPGPEESPPTLLQNPRALSGGEDLVRFYQTPAYRAWDPSVVVFLSFALFFAMILADGGYAALMAVGLAFYWRRLGKTETAARWRVLLTVLAGFSLLYGIAIGSYFGVEPPAGSFLDWLRILDMNDFAGMMRISLIIGAAHVILANGLTAWQQRKTAAALAPLGWMAIVVGGLLWWLTQGKQDMWTAAGPVLVAIGTPLVFLFSGAQSMDETTPWSKALLRRALNGSLALTGISKAFGDVLSYMRLFALGLGSASLAITFNDIAGQVAAAIPGLGLLLAGLILLLGHTLNILLAIVSGVVHGLRLNYIEFFHWGLSDEGYPFRPYAKKETES